MIHEYFDYFHIGYYGVTIFLIDLVTGIHVLLNKHEESASAVLWLLFVFYFPVIGVILYLIFGINRVYTRGIQVKLANELIKSEKTDPVHNAFANHYSEQKNFIYTTDIADYPGYCKMLDRLLPDTLPLEGNFVELLMDGTKAYPRMLKEIEKAKRNIHLQSFIIMNDPIGSEILGALEKKAREGVDVKVLYDRFGSLKSGMLYRIYGRGLKNFQIHPFLPFSIRAPWTIQLRNHRKLLIIDGKTVFTGGINISKDNDSRWSRADRYIHDLHCLIKGPAVGEFQFSFLRDWFYVTSQRPNEILREEHFPILKSHGNSIVRVVSSGPGHDYEATEKVFMTAISTAEKYVWIISPYFIPDKPFWKAMCATVARGVEVRVVLPKKNNHWYVQFASQSLFMRLLENGVKIYEKEGSFSHAKAMLVDGVWAYMGSSNCDIRSFRLNYELDFVVARGDFLNVLHNQFMTEMASSKEVMFQDIMKKSLFQQLAENGCALFTPVM